MKSPIESQQKNCYNGELKSDGNGYS